MRRNFAAILVALFALFLVFGCTGPVEQSGLTDTDTGTGSTSPSTGEAGTSDSGTTDNWNLFQFKPGQHFKFEMDTGTGEDSQTGFVTIDVGQASGDQYPFDISYQIGDVSGDLSVNSTGENLPTALASPQGIVLAPFLMGTIWNPYITTYGGGGFSNWQYTEDGETVAWSWEGTSSYAGVSCQNGTVTINGQPVYSTCFSPDLGMSIYTKVTDEQSGETEYEAVLTEYSE